VRLHWLASHLLPEEQNLREDARVAWLRVWTGFILFTKHGLEKLMHFSQMAQHFPDPLHIGSHPSLAFALLSDAICSILVMLGFATPSSTLKTDRQRCVPRRGQHSRHRSPPDLHV
jgi:DoxX